MSQVRVLVLTGYGTNCHDETAYAAKLAGATSADIVHFSEIISGKAVLENYQILIFPGGFLDGDDMGAAQAAAQRWLYMKDEHNEALLSHLKKFIQGGNLALGICNGFQLMVKLGLVPALNGEYFTRQVTLTHNNSARFEDRWVELHVNEKSPCIFTKGLKRLAMPVRHGEGRIVAASDEILQNIISNNLVALQYADPESGLATEDYPANPNGSPYAIAGLTDPSGRCLGLMPHPEAFNHDTNAPEWLVKKELPLGIALLENAVKFFN